MISFVHVTYTSNFNDCLICETLHTTKNDVKFVGQLLLECVHVIRSFCIQLNCVNVKRYRCAVVLYYHDIIEENRWEMLIFGASNR